jgi:hypothetical protein
MMVDGLRFKERLWLWVLTFVRTTRAFFVMVRMRDRPRFLTFDEYEAAVPVHESGHRLCRKPVSRSDHGRFADCVMMEVCQ